MSEELHNSQTPSESSVPMPGKPGSESTGNTAQAPPVSEGALVDSEEAKAKSLGDEELAKHIETASTRNQTRIIPYLREAHNRFAQPGRRVPVKGQPTWTEWVEDTLGFNVRTVQRWLAEPSVKKSPGGHRGQGTKPDPANTVRIELVLSKAEAEQLIAAGKVENPTDTYYGIYEAAVRATSMPTEGTHHENHEEAMQSASNVRLASDEDLLNSTIGPIAAYFVPLLDKDLDDFATNLRSYFQAVADHLTAGTGRIHVSVVTDSLGAIDEAA